MSDNAGRTGSGGRSLSAEHEAPAARALRLRKLPPRPGGGDIHSGGNITRETAGTALQVVRILYPVSAVLLLGGIVLAARTTLRPPAGSHREPAIATGNLVAALQRAKPVKVYRPKTASARHGKSVPRSGDTPTDAADSPADAREQDAAGPVALNLKDLIASIKRPGSRSRDLAQLRQLLQMLKKKGPGSLNRLAQLQGLLKSMQKMPGSDNPDDFVALQELLARLEKKGDDCSPRDADAVRMLLNRISGRNAPVDPDDDLAVRLLLEDLVPDVSAIAPHELEQIQQLLKRIVSRKGPVDLADVQHLRQLLAANGNASAGDLDAAESLSAVLQDATGKPAAASLDYFSRLQAAAGDRKNGEPAISLTELQNLQGELATTSGNRSDLQLVDLNQFEAIIRKRTGRDADAALDDPQQELRVLQELTGKSSGPYLELLAAATGADNAPDDPQDPPRLADLNALDQTLSRLSGDGASRKLHELDADSLSELRDLIEQSRTPSGDARERAEQLAALIRKMTGSTEPVSPEDLERSEDLVHSLSTEGVRNKTGKTASDSHQASEAAPIHAPGWELRPKFPTGLFPRPAATVNLDLTAKDLGNLLSGQDWPDGTLFVVSGVGVHLSSPIVVEGKSLRLHFLQDSDDPLVLIPRSGTPRLKTAGGQMLDDALITVINGSLEITDARIGISSYEQFGTVTLPRWFVQVVNGNLSLRHCRIKGPSGASSRNRGLVRWTQLPVERKAEPTEGAYDQQALIVDSFLSCDQTLVNADARRRAFFMHNCVAVGNPVLALNITGSEPAIDGAVDMQRSTFCSLESVIVMRASPFGTPATSPLRIFSNHCVVAPPYKLGETTHQSALLRYGAPVIDERQVIWHEYFNAYAAATQFCLRESSAKSPPVVQPFSDWMQTQGVEQFSSPLLEPDGIRLTAELQRRDRIRAQDLALDSGCAAADGGDDGTALGADIQKIVAPLSRSSQPLPMQQKNPAGAAPQF